MIVYIDSNYHCHAENPEGVAMKASLERFGVNHRVTTE